MNEVEDLRDIILSSGLLSGGDPIDLVCSYYHEILEESKVQNLTTLTSPADFFEGHLLDCLELSKLINLGWISTSAMDLGSGCGVPGLLTAIIQRDTQPIEWVLAESEVRKAEFLGRTVRKLGLKRVFVAHKRGEDYLRDHKIESVVSRAVGSVSKQGSWLIKRSTWNNLILFKGPKWEEEWSSDESALIRKKLKIESEHRYLVGKEEKKRVIIKLTRRD